MTEASWVHPERPPHPGKIRPSEMGNLGNYGKIPVHLQNEKVSRKLVANPGMLCYDIGAVA